MSRRNKWKRTGMSPHGEWIPIRGWEDEIEAWECPHCHNLWQLMEGLTPEEHRFYFCPRCGAKILGGKEDE